MPKKAKIEIEEIEFTRDDKEFEKEIMDVCHMMLGRGAPTVYDDTGFNKVSFSSVMNLMGKYQRGQMEREDYQSALKHLIRHKGQIAGMKGMYFVQELYAYQKKLENAFPVAFVYEKERARILLKIPYNEKLIAAIKTIPTARWFKPYWAIDEYAMFAMLRAMTEVLPEFKQEFISWAKENGISGKAMKEKYAKQIAEMDSKQKELISEGEKRDAPLSVKLSQNGNKIVLSMSKYDAAVVAAVKGLPYTARKYDSNTRDWLVLENYHNVLVAEIKKTSAVIKDECDMRGIEQVESPDSIMVDKKENLDLSAAMALLEPYKKIGRFEQYQHQLEGEAFMLTVNDSVIQADDMGLGKTIQSMIVANIKRKEMNSPVLVVPPAAIKKNWVKELFMWLGQDAGFVQIIGTGKGSSKTRTFYTNNQAGSSKPYIEVKKNKKFPEVGVSPYASWVIVNYDILDKVKDTLSNWIDETNCQIGIFDEAHYLKNETSLRSKVVLGYKKPITDKKGGDNKTKYITIPGLADKLTLCYALTGTPSTGRNKDFWPLIRLIKHPLAKSRKTFLQRYCKGEATRFGVDYNQSINTEELVSVLSDRMIQRMKKDVLSLPPKTRQYRYIDVDLDEYWDTWDAYVATYEEKNKKPFNEECAHLTELSVLRNVASKMKLPSIVDFVEEVVGQKRKIVVFTNYKVTAQTLLEKYGDRAVKIVGGMNDDSRQKAVDDFQNNPDVMLAVCNFKAAAVGITLTAASDVLMADLCWLPSDHFQAEDRAYRIGQLMNVNVTYMIGTGTHEEVVQKAVEEKAAIIEILEKKNFQNAEDWRVIFGQFLKEAKELRASA